MEWINSNLQTPDVGDACWIVYDSTILVAYFDDGWYILGANGDSWFSVTAVIQRWMPIAKPALPNPIAQVDRDALPGTFLVRVTP